MLNAKARWSSDCSLRKGLKYGQDIKNHKEECPYQDGDLWQHWKKRSSGCLAFNSFKMSHCWVQYQKMLETDIIPLLLHYTDTLKHFINSIGK